VVAPLDQARVTSRPTRDRCVTVDLYDVTKGRIVYRAR
jgi:hypothetical protein